jgi:hypothetical protein
MHSGYLPGVLIFHSRNPLHRMQIGNVLDREDRLVLSGMSSGGSAHRRFPRAES